MPKRLTKEEFIEKAIAVHGDRYDYSLVVYIHSKMPVKIICPIHGVFEQRPNNHLNGKGCSICAKQNTIDVFIKKAVAVHGDRYDYSLVVYVDSKTKLKIICPIHGVFEQTPANHISGQGCPGCKKLSNKKLFSDSTEIFIKKAIAVHGDLYDYSLVVYVDSKIKVKFICPIHGVFEQAPSGHINGKGCMLCGQVKTNTHNTKTTAQFIKEAIDIHGDKYDYSLVVYISAHEKVKIICPIHGVFDQEPNSHLQGKGCIFCKTGNVSKKAIEWLEHISKEQNIYIQHAMNEGEYKIPNTGYKVDGFCKENNTVYEFLGDYWHGNPMKYASVDTNPTSKITYGELYSNTMYRLEHIASLGYNLIYLWENDQKKV